MTSYYASEPYLRLAEAMRSRDYAQVTHIIDDQIAGTTGTEKSFWLILRVGKRSMGPGKADFDLAWIDLEAAVRLSPDDPGTRRSAMISGLKMFMDSEKPGRLTAVVQLLRRDLPRLKQDWTYCFGVSFYHMLTNRWPHACAAVTRGIDGLLAAPRPEYEARRGYLPQMHCWRAIQAVACNQPAQASGDITTAEQLFPTCSAAAQSPVLLGMARAELALHQERLAEARSHLQVGITRSGWNLHVSGSPTLIKVDLLAARIARAEGNQAGFRHFAEKAMARAEHHDLPLSAALIRRVMAGAER